MTLLHTPGAAIPVNERQTVDLLGLVLDAFDEKMCIAHVINSLRVGRGGWVITANLDHLRRYVVDSDYHRLCEEADVIVADGKPLVWAARLQGDHLPEQVAGSNLIWRLCAAASAEQRSVYLLGGDPGTAEAAAEILEQYAPGLRIAGTACPSPGFEHDSDSLSAIIEGLREAQPDIVFVALGSPKQEALISQIRHHLPDTWWIGVGFSFSFVSGAAKRAPSWMQRVGLEWLHRLCQEPGRLFRRYVVHGIPFALRLFAASLRVRFSGRRRHAVTVLNRPGI